MKKITALALRKALADAKTRPTNRQGRSIAQNVKQSLSRVLSVPDAGGTGAITTKEGN